MPSLVLPVFGGGVWLIHVIIFAYVSPALEADRTIETLFR